ncbi:MAG TPA: EthD domain-containing protein [Burkholderiales bacterium]|jgi:uncharacterized protein (TIGR02118 family)|nr:EthD domain-containing protein [Burkholderiales bacterium]
MSTFKVVRMAKRGDKLPAEFRQEWLERHRELKRAVSKVVAAVAHDSNKDAEYSGMSSMYYSSAAEARAALGDDPAKMEVACEEQVIAQQGDSDRRIKPMGQINLVRAYVRRKDLSLAQFKDYWLKTHANFHKRLVSETPVLRSRASIALPPPPGGNEPRFDGLVELYVSSTDDLRALLSAPAMQLARKDEENFVQLDAPVIALVAEEYVL